MLPHALLALTAPFLSPVQDWPQFLGPDRTGVVADSDWTASGTAEPLWSKNVGAGYSCPSVAGERLVTMGFDAEAERDVVLCLDAESGEERWRHAYPAADAPRYHGGGTLTTPTIVGSTVYTVNRHGRAFALDLATGEPLWERDYRADAGLDATFHGYCASPVVVGERIVYAFGGVALAAARDGGEILWRTEDHGDGAYTNPTVFELRGRTLVAVMLAQILFVFDLASGEVVHRYEWPLDAFAVHVAHPLVVGDRLLLSTAYGKGAGMLRLGDELEPELLWTSRRLRNKVTGLYLHDGHVYGFDESMLKCFDLEGNEKWRTRGLGMGALSIAGGRLLVLSSRGELIVAEATPEEFRELSRRKVLDGGSYWTMPVLSRGRIFVRNSLGDLACLDHRAAEEAQAAPLAAGDAPAAPELFAANDLLVGGAAIRKAPGLRLRGDWEILGRGMARSAVTLVLGPPNRWTVSLDAEDFAQTFDGELAWERNDGALELLGEDQPDAGRVLALVDLLAPVCPGGASVAAKPVAFAGVACWRVDSTLPVEDETAEEGTAERWSVQHYFAVEGGRLVGREGDRLSTTAFHGTLAVGDTVLPERIALYRLGSGQEETLYVAGGEWIEPPAGAFDRPAGLQRLLRTPEQREADTRRLRGRYAEELGAYRADSDEAPLTDLTILVRDGDLWAKADRGETLLLPEEPDEAGGETFRMVDFGGAAWRFAYDEAGRVTGAVLTGATTELAFTRAD
ncbi:MAG: PQQ-binding-like beta-propeller repeat protein [Planctomycetota bacterium]